MGYSLLGVLWEGGWKTVGTKQGLTPNSRVNTLKNGPGGSCPCRAGKTLLCQGWGGGSRHRGGGRQSTHVTGQTSRHMVRYRGDGASNHQGGASMAGVALGWVLGKGRCQAAPRLLSQRWCTGQPGLCPSHCRSPQYIPAGTSRVVQHGQKEKKRDRQRLAHPSAQAALARAGIKVHRGKGRVRGLEAGGQCGGAQASSQQRDIPQKRPFELHREGAREKKRKGRGVSGSSVGGTDKQTQNHLTGYRLWPGLCQGCNSIPR